MTKLHMVFCDSSGRIYDHPHLLLAGMDGPEPEALDDSNVIPVPRGSDLMVLPGRIPVGIDPSTGEAVECPDWEGTEVFAAAVFMAPAFTQTHRAAYRSHADAPALPLYAYTALGFSKGKFYAAGFRVDDDIRQDPWRFDVTAIKKAVETVLSVSPDNRLLQQLKKCSLEYRCRAAQNFFLARHEAPLPVSTVCNCRCVGCISMQKDGSFKASHDRLATLPAPEDVAEVALMHIEKVKNAVVSFGQGCEGEPLLQVDLLLESIRLIRKETSKGTINLNTNGSMPAVIEKLIDAGMDSTRVSVNSFQEDLYNAYYKPNGYALEDVLNTIKRAGERRCFISLNLLVFPGVTDTEEELSALASVLDGHRVNMIQMRNLNIDPEIYINCLPPGSHRQGLGVAAIKEKIEERYPGLKFGYFNPSVEAFR